MISNSTAALADTFDDELQAQATELRTRTPTMGDKSTRLDTVSYANRVFTYRYSILTHPSTDYGPAERKKYADLLKQQVVGRACTTESGIKQYIDAGISFRYMHFGSDNRLIASAAVAKSDCSGLSVATGPARTSAQVASSASPPEPPSEPTDAPTPGAPAWSIRRNAKYADVMALLRGFPSEKETYGDYLNAKFKAPQLLAYPDAGGTCTLSFEKGRLWKCEGCDPDRFQCDKQ